MQWLNPGVETLHHAIKRHFPGAKTASINEPCDSGADYSTFDLVRNGQRPEPPPGPDDLPDATERFVRPSKDYRWGSRVDHTAVEQFASVWVEAGDRPPTFTWVNFTLTDSAFHLGGPYSEMAAAAVSDTDARVGRIFEQVERSGVWDDCAFFLVADHGMEETDPKVRGDWGAVSRGRCGRQGRGLRVLVPDLIRTPSRSGIGRPLPQLESEHMFATLRE